MDELTQTFQQRHPEITVRVSYGSSGQFFEQIRHGAPIDIYCSADVEYPRRLGTAGLTVPGSEFLYAIGRIVIWVRSDSKIDLQRGIDALRENSIRHIAIANPGHAPYGKSAVAAMKAFGIHESVESKLVFGENVQQALQFVQTGSAEIGIVALSLALAPSLRDSGRYWEIPADRYPRMEQGGVIIKSSQEPVTANEFRSFVLGADGRAVLKRYGFFLPE